MFPRVLQRSRPTWRVGTGGFPRIIGALLVVEAPLPPNIDFHISIQRRNIHETRIHALHTIMGRCERMEGWESQLRKRKERDDRLIRGDKEGGIGLMDLPRVVSQYEDYVVSLRKWLGNEGEDSTVKRLSEPTGFPTSAKKAGKSSF